MSYFRELPNVAYQSNLLHKISSREYVVIKNLFRRVKIRDEIKDQVALYEKYTIRDGERPDTIADKLYGSPELDWIVVLSSGITNIKSEWPLSNRDVYRYAEGKYGTELNAVHHYETLKVNDSKGRLVLPAGQIVNKEFTIPAPYEGNYTAVGAYEDTEYSGNSDINPVIGISNFEYETRENEKKRKIELLKSNYVGQFVREIREIMNYGESSQFVNEKLIRTENTRLIGP